jgi:hypothetical protein
MCIDRLTRHFVFYNNDCSRNYCMQKRDHSKAPDASYLCHCCPALVVSLTPNNLHLDLDRAILQPHHGMVSCPAIEDQADAK